MLKLTNKPNKERLDLLVSTNNQEREQFWQTKNVIRIIRPEHRLQSLHEGLINLEKLIKSYQSYLQTPQTTIEKKEVGEIIRKIADKLRNRMNKSIARAYSNPNPRVTKNVIAAVELLGCSLQEAHDYLTTLFVDGMTWENYGRYWHIDHIVPCAYFNHLSLDQQKLCFHYTNLQPLLKLSNISKNSKHNGKKYYYKMHASSVNCKIINDNLIAKVAKGKGRPFKYND